MTRSGRRYGHICAWATILIATLATSCGDYHRTAWSHFEDIDSGGWDPTDIILFEPWPADSAEAASSVYDIDLVLRSTLRSGFSRIPVVITIEDNEHTISTYTVII